MFSKLWAFFTLTTVLCSTTNVLGPNDVNPDLIRFFLYRQNSINDPVEIFVTKNEAWSKFSPTLSTVIFTHGFQGSHMKEAAQTMKDGYLTRMDVNLILVDYEPYNQPYEVLVTKTKAIGSSIADLVNSLMANNVVAPGTLHLIGHSMGAHISGFAANKINVPVPRVTGLDPAGPMFKGKEPADRLSDDDAGFVDCIFTSLLGIGTPICTVNFFVGGGSNQPNCANVTGDARIGCDHQESFKYYSRSIATPEVFVAAECPTEFKAKYSLSDCSPVTNAVMGYNCKTSTKRGIYHVTVVEQPPNSGSGADATNMMTPCKLLLIISTFLFQYIVRGVLHKYVITFL